MNRHLTTRLASAVLLVCLALAGVCVAATFADTSGGRSSPLGNVLGFVGTLAHTARAYFALPAHPPSPQAGSTIAGNWTGTMKREGVDITVSVHFEEKGGTWTGFTDIPDMGWNNLVVQQVSLSEDGTVTFLAATKADQLSFSGVFTGDSIQGMAKLKQLTGQGTPFGITFTRFVAQGNTSTAPPPVAGQDGSKSNQNQTQTLSAGGSHGPDTSTASPQTTAPGSSGSKQVSGGVVSQTTKMRGSSGGDEDQGNDAENTEWHGTNYALLFAVDNYEHGGPGGWPTLTNPIGDAQAIADELSGTFGFQVDLVKNPTRMQIQNKLLDYRRHTFQPDDQLFIFFAGHGTVDRSTGAPVGYLVPEDALPGKDDPTFDSFLEQSKFLALADAIPASHILVATDACFSGVAGESKLGDPSMRAAAPETDKMVADMARITRIAVHNQLKAMSRKLLTSGGDEYVPDDNGSGHSPFANALMRSLFQYSQQGFNAVNFEVLIGTIKNFTSADTKNPVPRYGYFGKDKPAGEFFFLPAKPTR